MRIRAGAGRRWRTACRYRSSDRALQLAERAHHRLDQRRQVRNEILAARALVLPSFAEGLPVVIMEAMALRRPVISTFVAGIPELVHPGEHGWLVPAGDVEALASAMQACLDTPTETLARMGETRGGECLCAMTWIRRPLSSLHCFESLADAGHVRMTRAFKHSDNWSTNWRQSMQ